MLSPTGTGWQSQHVLNPGVVYRNGEFQMLYRAGGGGPDQIGLATSLMNTRYGPRYVTATVIPATLYEINGRNPNPEFMNSILFHSGQWYTYYGAADTVIATAATSTTSA